MEASAPIRRVGDVEVLDVTGRGRDELTLVIDLDKVPTEAWLFSFTSRRVGDLRYSRRTTLVPGVSKITATGMSSTDVGPWLAFVDDLVQKANAATTAG